MRGSSIANSIDEEYKKRSQYKDWKRQDCKMKECKQCDFQEICDEGGIIQIPKLRKNS